MDGRPARALAALALALCSLAARGDEQVEAGRYLVRAAGCVACHTDTRGGGGYLAGGAGIETPFGVFYAPNITPHPSAGIGAWTADQFADAMLRGVGPDGHYFPVFPYTSYTRMRREDVDALWAYLGTVEPSDAASREHDVGWYLWRIGNWFWKLLFFDEGTFEPDPAKSATWNRGAYLAEALGHCAECHSPRSFLGAIDEDLRYAGTRAGPEGAVPNITSDEANGIGEWATEDVAEYLSSGFDPDYDVAGGAMALVIDEGTSHLTEADRAALAEFITSLAPIRTGSGDE